MRAAFAICLAFLLTIPGLARAQNPSPGGPHLDAALRAMLDRAAQARAATALARRRSQVAGAVVGQAEVRPGAAGERRRAASPGEALALEADPATGAARLGVFVRLRGPEGLAELRAAGAEVGSTVGNLVTARVPLSALNQLAQATGIEAMEAAHRVTLANDSGAKAIGLSNLRLQQNGVWSGATGKGAIVAIYDTGLDLTQGDFRDPAGNTRVLAVWDQTGSGNPPLGFDYGFYCDHDAIQRTLAGDTTACPERDIHGHGTHVTGTAAGDGSAPGSGPQEYQFAGMAPDAGLVIVKGGNGSFFEDQIIDGLAWIKARAAEYGRPTVVNLSLGGQFGAHDGSRLYEEAIDNLSGPGFIVVIAAGNDGTNANTTPVLPTHYIHARGLASTGSTTPFTFVIPSYTAAGTCDADYAVLSFWYSGQDHLQITVTRPNGTTTTAPTGSVATTDDATGHVRIDNASLGPDPGNGDMEAEIRVNGCGTSGPPAEGAWGITVTVDGTGSGHPYDMWLYDTSFGFDGATGGQGFDDRYIVASPGNARRAVTVGAFVTRLCWPTATAAKVCYVQQEQLGDLARFSAAGPTRDDRLKPEITAPGLGVISSLSRDVIPVPQRLAPDGAHFTLEGTSMATPHVTGSIAVLYQFKPDLTPEEVKDIFAQTANHDVFTARTYDTTAGASSTDWWGYGKLNVCKALQDIAGPGAVAQVSVTPATDTLPQGATSSFTGIILGACDEATFNQLVWTSSNPVIAAVDGTGVVHALQPGSTLIVASYQGNADTARVEVVPPAVLTLAARSLAPTLPTLAPRGTRLPLLLLTLNSDGYEAIDVQRLGFDVTGYDPSARLLLLPDLNGDGVDDGGETPLASAPAPLTGGTQRVLVSGDPLRVDRATDRYVIVALELSGTAPNQTTFETTLVPSATGSIGDRSGAEDRLQVSGTALSSGPAITTVLNADEAVSLSENPVRSDHLHLNFREPPTTAAIYTVSGRRVLDLPVQNAGAVDWDLTNADGSRVVPGVYLLVFRVGGTLYRVKLFVLTPAR